MRQAWVVIVAAAAACSGGERRATTGRDSTRHVAGGQAGEAVDRPAGVEVLRVNRGTQGMRSTTRWVLSPDRQAIIVVEDAVSVEAEALPDGFLYASERTDETLQVDSVWDVAPAPDWTRLAFGRAYVLRAGERDTMPTEEWRRLEAALPEDVTARDSGTLLRQLKAHAFPASGMSLMLGVGLTQVVWVDTVHPRHHLGPTHSLNGWRVRWTPSGDTLGVGGAPRTVQDDAPPTRWVLVQPRRWARYSDTLGGTADSSRFASVAWVRGPTIELAVPIDLSSGPTLGLEGGMVYARNGMIRIARRGPDGRSQVRVVGPGIPLAVTAGGRFVAALVPRAGAMTNEMAAYPVIYHVRPR